MEKKFGRGDIVWVDFDPVKGHEQAGKRPALVISAEAYNQRTRLFLACPITSQSKGYPFEVPITGKVHGVILVDQIRNIDWNARQAQYVGKAADKVMRKVSHKLSLILP